MEASITQERRDALLSELNQLYWHCRCTKRELLSLIGKLSFTCKVIPLGRIFLRRLIDLSTTVKKLHHHLPLSQEAKLDSKWWLEILPQWSGRSLIPGHPAVQWNFSPMPLVRMDGMHTGQVDGSQPAGPECKPQWALPGRNFMLLSPQLIHGVHYVRAEKS